ncbi:MULTISPECIES: sensor histidine kinase [Caproicibacterium]|uniref:Sensor histidine kinase n=1 Tax=Caproicibacterium argilliputei TaxID=3030016 RepID=A0AA97DCU6_9FIRM|nr:sensor histidine kinase [Caproicibacterium argilliputei]WOC33126.1 sensor histidine kinase [Caproicibacterium argilliputei]
MHLLAGSRKSFQTIKSRIQLICVAFSLLIALVTSAISVSFFQTYARQNVVQSTEFNLQLVSSLIGEDLSDAEMLEKRCALLGQMEQWLQSPEQNPQETLQMYYALQNEYNSSRVRQYVLRLVVVNRQRTKLIQISSSTVGTPLTVYNVDKLVDFHTTEAQAWQSVSPDPLLPSLSTLTACRPVYSSAGHTLLGYVYLSVRSNIITDQLQGYVVTQDNRLFVQLPSEKVWELQNHTLLRRNRPAGTPALLSDPTMGTDTKVMRWYADGAATDFVVHPVSAISKMYLANELSQQLVRQQLLLYARLLLLVCAAILLMGFLIGFVLDRLINPPVASLRSQLDRVAKGDFSPAPELEWNNEFGDIGRGINHLSQSVDQLLHEQVEIEKKKKDLEYRMLQSQISPHFLYNTLNSIKWMATIQGASGIAEMTTALARLLKSIAKGTRELIPLREETALLDDYYVIQKYRYGGAITFRKELDPAVLDTPIPRFTLQPLMENAIFHGIEPKGGAGTLLLKAMRLQSGDIAVLLMDDGVGMTPQEARQVLQENTAQPTGMFAKLGLHNVNQRLRYDFGEPYGLSIESRKGEYTKMVVLLPGTAGNSPEPAKREE